MAEVVKIKPKPPRAPTYEERKAYLDARMPELIRTMPPMPTLKPKPAPEVRAPLVGKVGEVAKANPAGVEVRVTARDADGVTYVQPPIRPREIVQPLEVDREGRVSRARVVDCSTGQAGYVDYRDGYRQSGVVSDWNPLDALKRD